MIPPQAGEWYPALSCERVTDHVTRHSPPSQETAVQLPPPALLHRCLENAPSRAPVVGVLLAGDRTYPSFIAFTQEMERLGYKDGATLRLEPRFAEDRLDDLP